MDSLSLSRQFAVEAHARAIDSCTEIEDLRRISKSLLELWQLQASFSAQYGAELLSLQQS
ncbi:MULTISPECIES: hypothetical protein [unclassified Synechococcus]|uniref:hypothetical protein n=1 Tax=unclassified Synechococcus TaxID=2626047 RepID=UPI0021A47414|nr:MULTISPECIES: hypothetical protein [unclassified Synechococcus]MCT0213523.1 hypothetical protein [Synechococcus sp. CS-1326]MCT0234680.1 hypothetical protein [Synechococcus sp. CS-1327]